VRDCLRRASRSDWFNWLDGSHQLFWRWDSDLVDEARDGREIYHTYIPAPGPKARHRHSDPVDEAKLTDKIHKFLDRCDLVPLNNITTAVAYFGVK
jgi:hypothetical protein